MFTQKHLAQKIFKFKNLIYIVILLPPFLCEISLKKLSLAVVFPAGGLAVKIRAIFLKKLFLAVVFPAHWDNFLPKGRPCG
jgi:hypothetical protein